jgi:uncharacterized membrane protein required for colicin V production
MEGLDIPNIATGGALAVIIVLFGLIGLFKGVARMFFGLIALSAGAVAAYWGFKYGGSIASYLISKPGAWMSGATGIIIGLAVLFTARALFGVLIKPTKVQDGKKKNHPMLGGAFGLLCGIVFCWFALSSIRYVGTLVELEWIAKCLSEEGKINKEPKPALTSLRDLVDSTTVGAMHRQNDPLNNPAGAQLAKLRVVTESPYAIAQVSVNNGVRGAFRQADIREFLQSSPDLTAFVADAQFSHLIEAPSIKKLSANPDAQEVLVDLDVADALGIQPEVKEKPIEAKKEEKPIDPNAPKPGSARIF